MFTKLDINANGQINVNEFREGCRKFTFGLKNDEINMIFKAFVNADSLNFNNKFGLRTVDDFEKEEETTSVGVTFKYR